MTSEHLESVADKSAQEIKPWQPDAKRFYEEVSRAAFASNGPQSEPASGRPVSSPPDITAVARRPKKRRTILDGLVVSSPAPQAGPGRYRATVRDIEPRRGVKGPEPYLAWWFSVDTPDGVRTHVEHSTIRTGRRSKIYSWATALVRPPIPGEPLEDLLRAIKGKACTLVLTLGDDGYVQVGELLPLGLES